MKKLGEKSFRLQSAMEYLMTYGWAFLIIAVVLIALVLLGVFSPSTFTGNSCIVTSQFLCSGLTPTTTSILITSFAQNTGSTWYAPTFFLTPMQNSNVSSTTNLIGEPMYNLTDLSTGQQVSLTLAIRNSNTTTQAYYFAPAGTAVSADLWAVYSTKPTSLTPGECITESTTYTYNSSCVLIQVGRITYKSVG
ncbi:MAG: hypothetical protein ARM1_0029 [Candidatus Micrarchaeota archaeon]|nr:MAG: hypothetical protein ARM1_0029 [Candidatus Micrarchaeota archaeon]